MNRLCYYAESMKFTHKKVDRTNNNDTVSTYNKVVNICNMPQIADKSTTQVTQQTVSRNK